MAYHEFSTLTGRTIVKAYGLERGSEKVIFECADGSEWQLSHYQDCCESVEVEDVVGDVDDLLDALVLDAREETNGNSRPEGHEEDSYESFTWTFYILQTNKGAVTIRWLGVSNGYYSEGVSFDCNREASIGAHP